MKRFAFLTHPLNIGQLKNFSPFSRKALGFLQNIFSKDKLPFSIFKIRKVRSSRGEEIESYFLVLPFLPEQIKKSGEDWLLEKISQANETAGKLDCQILGLGGYAAVIGDEIFKANKLKLPVTTGSAFTAWSVFEAIYRLAKTKNIDLKKSHLAIIGATSAIGALCAKKLAGFVSRISINSIDNAKLHQLEETILHLGAAQVNASLSVLKAIEDAEIIIFAEALTQPNLNLEGLRSGAVVCDVSVEGGIAEKLNLRSDITILDAGLIKMPYAAKFRLDAGLPKDIIPASLAETMLLTFENRFINYSLGENINPDRMEEIANIAVQQGFEVWAPQAPVL